MMTFNTTIMDPMHEMLVEVASFIPTLVTALIILILGMVIAKLVSHVIHRLFKEIKIDKLAEKIGMSGVLHKGGVKRSLSETVSHLVYWVFVVIFILITIKALGLTIVSDSLDRLLDYVPHALSAAVILVLGTLLAKVMSSLAHFVMSYMDLPKPKLVERVIRWSITIYAITISVEELGFGSLFIGTTFHILFAGVVLGLALAYGLGGKDAAAKHLQKYGK